MADHDDTQPIAPQRNLEPADPPADADVTSGGPGTPPVTDADIIETVVDVTRLGGPPAHLVTHRPVEITETPDEVMFVGSDAVIEVWHRPQPAGKVAEASLVDADRGVERSFVHLVATGDAAGACELLMNHLLVTEATRAAAEPGDVTPAFGLGEPPLYEVAAHRVREETRLQAAELYRRNGVAP